MILLQDAPAQTTAYMIAGYAVIFGTLLIYSLSIALRTRNLKQELQILDTVQQVDQ